MYMDLIESGTMSFNDIDEADYYGLIDLLSSNEKQDVMTGAEFFKTI
jgi:hypothetical protein